jgi:hypothetical protein
MSLEDRARILREATHWEPGVPIFAPRNIYQQQPMIACKEDNPDQWCDAAAWTPGEGWHPPFFSDVDDEF